MPQKQNYVNGALDVAVQIARERLNVLHDLKVRCQKQEYDAVLLQCLRHFLGLEPDPQLKERAFNERKAAASETQPHKTA